MAGTNCPCYHGYCLFDVEVDPNKRHDLRQSMPGMVQQLLARPTEVSKTGTQGAHLCRNASVADDAADDAALKGELARTGGLPAVRRPGQRRPWLNDVAT